MMCPACNTNNAKCPDAEYCVQCSSDLGVHRLLQTACKQIQKQNAEQKSLKIGIILPRIRLLLGLIVTVFGMFVGMRFLTVLERTEARNNIAKSVKAEIGVEQLQQISSIIERGLNLIIDQRQETQQLQAKVQELVNVIAQHPADPQPIINQEEQQ